jgi:SAM-dependent methyltransferase
LNQRYDFVLCTGVLHHMVDPQRGLQSLQQCLKRDGIMLLGFYSQKARKHLKQYKQELAEFCQANNSDITDDMIIQWRQSQSSEDKKRPFFDTADFFYLSGIKDCLLNPSEKEYNLPQLDTMLSNCDLVFKRMLLPHYAMSKYKSSLEDVFASGKMLDTCFWHQFEQKNPLFFMGMYNFTVTHKR